MLIKETFMEPFNGKWATFAVKTEILVQWGDMDAAQHEWCYCHFRL